MDSSVIAYFIYNIVLLFNMWNMTRVFFEKRKTSVYISLIPYLFYYIFSSFTFLMWNIPLINISISFLTYFGIALNYESKMWKRFLTSGSILSLALLFEGFGHAIYLQNDFVHLQHAGVAGSAGPTLFIICGTLSCTFSFLAHKFLRNIKKDTLDSPVYLGSLLTISVISYAIMFFILSHPYLSAPVMVSILAAIVAINVLALYFLDRLSVAFEEKINTALHTQEKEYYFAQSKLMQESVKKVRAIRHDMNLHLSTLRDFTTENTAATEYINNLLGDISESEVYSTTGNIAFDSIINFKLKSAREDNIKLDLSLLVPVQINIEIADIVTILGNLLNNALDAVAKVEDKRIILDIELSKGNLYIKIDNTFDGNVKYTDKEKRITTLKDGEEHGHGLNNIRKSVEKYNGHMDITHDGNIFSVGILLYV